MPEPSSNPAFSAVVLGATGAVGRHVVIELARSSHWGKVTALGRRPLELSGTPPEKLRQEQVDLYDPAAYENFLSGHQAAFCTLGVGQPSKVSRDELYRVDVEAVALFAEACRRQGVEHFSLLTAIGANPGSRIYYLRFKGEIEERIKALGFTRVSFFRPSMLMTPKNRYGFSQAMLLRLYPWLDKVLAGPMRNFRSIKVADLGRAMVKNAEKPGSGVEILHWSEFSRI